MGQEVITIYADAGRISFEQQEQGKIGLGWPLNASVKSVFYRSPEHVTPALFQSRIKKGERNGDQNETPSNTRQPGRIDRRCHRP